MKGGIPGNSGFATYRPPTYPKGKPDGECSMSEYAGCLSFTNIGAEGRKIVYEEESWIA